MLAANGLPPGDSLPEASRWVIDLLQGQFAVTIAVLAIAFLGFEMLGGRISLRNALRVVLGCFVLLGSSTIARGLMDAGRGVSQPTLEAALPAPAPSAISVPGYPMSDPPARANGNPFDPYSAGRPAPGN